MRMVKSPKKINLEMIYLFISCNYTFAKSKVLSFDSFNECVTALLLLLLGMGQRGGWRRERGAQREREGGAIALFLLRLKPYHSPYIYRQVLWTGNGTTVSRTPLVAPPSTRWRQTFCSSPLPQAWARDVDFSFPLRKACSTCSMTCLV
jgi:hypothetical protein